MTPPSQSNVHVVRCCSLTLNTNLQDHFSTTQNGRTKCNTCSQSFKCCCTSLRLHIVQQHPTFEIEDIMKMVPPLTTTPTNIITESTNFVSNVWDHFTKTRHGMASCDVCKVVLSIRGDHMNLMKHLRIQHSAYLNRIRDCVGKEIAIEQDEDNFESTKPRILSSCANLTKSSKPKKDPRTSTVKIETEYIDFIDFTSNVNEDAIEKRSNSVYNDSGSSDFEPDEAEQNSDSSANETEEDDDDDDVTHCLRRSSARGQFTFPTPDVAKCKGCNTMLSFRFKGTGNLLKHLKSELHKRRSNRDGIAVKLKTNRTRILQSGSKTEESMKQQEQLEDGVNTLVEFNDDKDNIPLSNISKGAHTDENAVFVDETEPIKPGSSKKTSPVWNHYREITKEVVECLACNRTIKTTDGASSNLLKHLRNKHPHLMELMTQPFGDIESESELETNPENNENISLPDKPVLNKVTKASAIWVHFKNQPGNKTKCKLCHHLLSARGGTSNLFKHLRARHKNEANAIISMRVSARGYKKKIKPKAKAGTRKLPKNQTVWSHFSEPSLGLAKCNTCDMLVSSADGDRANLRKNMRQHMLENHSDIIAELRRIHLDVRTLERTNATGMWRFFTRITDNEVECDECHTRLEHSGRSTYVLLKHMHAKHYELRESWKLNTNVPSSSHMLKRPALKPELKKSRSILWNYFTPKNDRRAECLTCKKDLSALSTSNLWKHLCAKHADIANKLSNADGNFDDGEMVDDNVGAEECVATEEDVMETGNDELELSDPEV